MSVFFNHSIDPRKLLADHRRLLVWGAPAVLAAAVLAGLLTTGGDGRSRAAMPPAGHEAGFAHTPIPSYAPRVAKGRSEDGFSVSPVSSADGPGPTTSRRPDAQYSGPTPMYSPRLAQAPASPPAASAAPGPAAASSGTVLKVYPCATGKAPGIAAQLQARFGDNPNVRIVPDGRTSQVLVMAPQVVQDQIARDLPEGEAAETTAPPSAIRGTTASAQSQAATPQGPDATHELQLWHTTGQQFEAELVRMLSDRLKPLAGSEPAVSNYALRLAEGRTLRLSIHRELNRVRVTGDQAALASSTQLVRVMDAPKPPADRSMRLVSLKGADSNDVRQVVDAVRSNSAAESAGSAVPRMQGGEQVAMAAQPADQAPAAPPAPMPDAAAVVAAPEGLAEGGGLLGSVQVEILPGTDIMVIRGHERDVQTVVDLIEQIEQIAVEAEPAVEIYPLSHVDCLPLAALLEELYQEVYSARQGAVSITALVKPNALLLVGREESVKTVVDLVKRLDNPVPPSTQFEVFRLKRTPAEEAQETIQEFFDNRYDDDEGALGTRVRVEADFRTNSLIVWAHPRDLAEVAAIIARLDGEDSETFNQVEIFKLKNSLAADLAPVLQDAITGQMYGQRTGQRAVFQQAGADRQFEAKSTRLQFITGDDQGSRLLNSGILTDAQITADERANALIVTASAESMPLIAALIKELDSLPTAEAQVKVFTVIYGDATNLLDMLETLFGAQAQTADLAVRTGAMGEDSSLVSLRFAVDVRTNSIIATGSAGDLEVVEGILARLDENDLRQRETVVVRLKNANSLLVADAVNQFLETELEAQQPVDGLLSSIEQIDREVVIVPEEITNSLIVSATTQYFSRIVDLIEKLDAQPPMVVIQVLIAAVDLDGTEEFGVELGLQDSVLFDRSVSQAQNGDLAGTSIPGFLFNSIGALGNSNSAAALASSDKVGGQAISNFTLGRSNSELGYGGLVLSASSESVSVLIRALQEDRRVEVLSRPQITTLDNVEGIIHVGENVPTIGSIDPATNLASQTFNVTYIEVGLQLRVTPRITPDGKVVMQITAIRSRLGPEEEGIPISVSAQGATIRSPRIEIAEAQATISARDGQTVVMGGLIETRQEEFHRQVPCLGDVPVLGHLFRYDGVTERRSELIFILTPHIVEDEEDMERIKQIEAARMHWCYANVLDLHGEIFDRADEMPVIYPDLDPAGRGIVPPEAIPTPAGAPMPTNASPFMVEPPAPDPAEAAEASKLRILPSPPAEGAGPGHNTASATAGPGTQERPGLLQPFPGQPGPDRRSPLAEAEPADYEFRVDPSLEAAPTTWMPRQ